MARNDFMEGFLQGLYNSGIGNPNAETWQNQNKQNQNVATQQAELNKNQSAQGNMPAPQPHPQFGDKLKDFMSTMVSGGAVSGAPKTLQTAFVPNPNAVTFGQKPTGEVSQFQGPQPAGVSPIEPKTGQEMLQKQSMQQEKPEIAPVPGMISKGGKPLFYNKLTGAMQEGNMAGVSTGYGNTMAPIRQTQVNEQLVNDALSRINPYFSKGPGKEQAARLDSISRIEPLLQQMQSQPGGGDPRQMAEAAIAFNKVLSGSGVGGEAQTQSLIPQTSRGKFANFAEWFTNEPQGTEQQAFVKRYADSVAREKTAITSRVMSQAESNVPTLTILKKSDPQSYKAVIDSVMGQFGTDQSTPNVPSGTIQPHPQDSEAVQWAKSNPNDPRAIKILQLNGAQ